MRFNIFFFIIFKCDFIFLYISSLRDPESLRDYHRIRTILHKSFSIWQEASTLVFREVPRGVPVDIEVRFASGDHRDNHPFDGPGQILAHAFYPGAKLGGDVHFDADENWVYDENLDDDEGIFFSTYYIFIRNFN